MSAICFWESVHLKGNLQLFLISTVCFEWSPMAYGKAKVSATIHQLSFFSWQSIYHFIVYIHVLTIMNIAEILLSWCWTIINHVQVLIDIRRKKCSMKLRYINETCLNQISLEPAFVFGIDRCWVYRGSFNKDFLHWGFIYSSVCTGFYFIWGLL